MNTNVNKIAYDLAGESTTRITALDGTTAQDVIEKRNIEKFNSQVDQYIEKFEKHSTDLKNFADELNKKNIENIEIMPISNYVLVKPFAENPFQRIVRDPKTGIITDIGGLRPEYKNTDNGEIEEEEQFIKVGVIQEVGYKCEAAQAGDTIFYTKVSSVPVPFYKRGLELVNETRILAIVNENLTERFNKIKKV